MPYKKKKCLSILYRSVKGALLLWHSKVSTNERSEMRTNESAPLSAPPWIGQAAYNDVDWVLSGVMETRDRWRVADNPISFDSDYMVFVSPPPVKVSKASAPIRPFNIYVSPEDQLGQGRALSLSLSCSDVEYRHRHHSPLQSGPHDDGLAPQQDRPRQN